MLTNDDGYRSQGIRKLYDSLKKVGHHVFIFAPENEQSSSSRKLSGSSEIGKEEDDVFYLRSGTPADTSLVALGRHGLPFLPDLVISGINNGFNASLDLAYSGTAAAAAEAVSLGCPAIAVSAQSGNDSALETAVSFITGKLERLYCLCGSDYFISINVPDGASCDRYRVSLPSARCHRGPEDFSDQALLSKSPAGSDLELLRSGYITISAISAFPSVSIEGQKILEDFYECGS